MPKLDVAADFQAALRLAADDAEAEGIPSREAAAQLYQAERKTIATNFAEVWIVEKLAGLIRERRAEVRRAKDRQYRLVGFRPPKTFTLPDGSKMEWAKATTYALERGRSVVYQKYKDYKHPAVQRFDKAIAFLEPFKAEQQRITWEEAVEIAPEPTQGEIES